MAFHIKIENVVASASLNVPIKLEKLVANLDGIEYEPEGLSRILDMGFEKARNLNGGLELYGWMDHYVIYNPETDKVICYYRCKEKVR